MVWELALIGCTILEIIVIIWGLGKLEASIQEEIELMDEKLDNKLALAIQSTGLAEPINPIQAAIAQMLTHAAQNKQSSPKDILIRETNGQFSKKD